MDKIKNTKNEEVEAFKETIRKTAEELVFVKFPQRVINLDRMLVGEKLSAKLISVHQSLNIPVPDVDSNHAGKSEHLESGASSAKKRNFGECPAHPDSQTGTKVLVLPNGVVPSNKFIIDLIDEVKPLIRELVEDANMLKMWLLFLIPRIEDGNNFGVSIQEDVLGEIRTSEGEAAAYFDQISRYFQTRGKTVAKVAKYPHIDDFRRTIREIDEKEFLSLRLIVAELRNHYATLHDMISKNLDKIRKPRSSNNEHMF
ncbi:Proteasome activator complex subunit 3 [Fragariocoptes setiger]|uniref:Proteasome activator complex subunit 3 n=1 Tax=Fragariocoptes setiger TaxID=1670756 RepID=A0ABQ7S5A1_9ACAR|nr:Proteasome activator complex subunit 3 [Fragariocoptes setiger]